MKPLRSRLLPAALLAAMLAVGCQKKEEAIKKKVVFTGPLLETSNVLTLFSDSARLQIKLTAPLEQQFESGDLVYSKGVMVTFYAKDGVQVVNTLRGNYGKYEKNKNLYVVRGNVVVNNEEKQQKLNTEELFFDKQKAQIYTKPDMLVRVATPTEILTGTGLTANQDFSRYRILHPTGVFTVAADPAKP
ncbi:LPS export ABC transporter periplasmic protein LptC [Hymenobacter sp. BT175]|uniref:LPS export ABC transporter periplasmic protein LptC n=1 Tax=Hymenobacter translucens TaxID=2886507 RepID=UPI001D0E7BD9|nr:LPS export ABC transporter periplasmic protein LptC [Hymenobacter translucens]MCC2545760.1 LPS export ABC transporter periplasmic protein LptC [Hymenobacter translucens]